MADIRSYFVKKTLEPARLQPPLIQAAAAPMLDCNNDSNESESVDQLETNGCCDERGNLSNLSSVPSLLAHLVGEEPMVTMSQTKDSEALPSDLPIPVSQAHMLEIIKKGPTQPVNCNFPKMQFSNGLLSFKKAWYNLEEAKGWLEYSIEKDRMFCFVCRLFENESREKNERNWISIGVSNWKKGIEKIRSHSKCKQHKSAESAHIHYLHTKQHVDVMLDHNRAELLSSKQREIENNRHYLERLVDVAKTLAKCGLAYRGHNEK